MVTLLLLLSNIGTTPEIKKNDRHVFYTVYRQLTEKGAFLIVSSAAESAARRRRERYRNTASQSTGPNATCFSPSQETMWWTLKSVSYSVNSVSQAGRLGKVARSSHCLAPRHHLHQHILHTEGVSNKRNSFLWLDMASFYIQSSHGTSFQYRFSANVWCGVIHGPFLLEGWLKGDIRATCLQHKPPGLLEDVSLTRTRMYYLWRIMRRYSHIRLKPVPS
jgi:hypothetical protein